jgi:peroxiredoxin
MTTMPKRNASTPDRQDGGAAERRDRRPSVAASAAARRRKLLAYGVPAAALAAIAAVAIVLTLGRGGGGKPSGPGEVEVGGPARTQPLAVGQAVPSFSAPGLHGGRVSWADARGAPTVLVVWASWCPHCQRELPLLGRVAPAFPKVRVLTVTTAIGLHPGPTSEGFFREHGLTFPVAVDDARDTVASALGVQAFPTTYWVGPDGTVTAVTQGEVGEAALRAAFQTLAAAR